MNKVAMLITFSQTVRVICETNEPSEDELISANIKAQQHMMQHGIYDTLDECVEDKECPYNPESDK